MGEAGLPLVGALLPTLNIAMPCLLCSPCSLPHAHRWRSSRVAQDHTIYALIEGRVKFTKVPHRLGRKGYRSFVYVQPFAASAAAQ